MYRLKEYLQLEEIKQLKNLKAYVLLVVGSNVKMLKEVNFP